MIDGPILFIFDFIGAFFFFDYLIDEMRGVEIVHDCLPDLWADAPT